MVGYSNTHLIKKLGIKAVFDILILNKPKDYWLLIGELPVDLTVSESIDEKEFDHIHLFTFSQLELIRLAPVLKSKLKKEDML